MISLGLRKLVYNFGQYVIEEYDGHSMWEGGDPVPTSDETLVYVLHRLNYVDLAEHSLPGYGPYNTVSLETS